MIPRSILTIVADLVPRIIMKAMSLTIWMSWVRLLFDPEENPLLTYPDPEVSTLTTLTNVQNALFVPDIPFLNRYYNRRPTYELSRDQSRITEVSELDSHPQVTRQLSRVPTNLSRVGTNVSRIGTNKPVPPTPGPPEPPPKSYQQKGRIDQYGDSSTPEPLLTNDSLARRSSITSHVEEEHFAVLPHGVTLDGWSQEDVQLLDDYVRHMLHSRRNRFKRSMKGFGKYIRKRKLHRTKARRSIANII